jgi:hypothetical protein
VREIERCLSLVLTLPAGINYSERKKIVNKYVIMAEVDQKWLDILGQITRNQEGFVWIEVKEAQDE